ncbi:hypothetical protein LCGC14_2576540 [marine sediment metagenome]|uniref:Uncharacterized protein n=1 Tax=marine sediment metagenome TaxID=412755 RepID=A0A0F9D8E4_9ZZZZ
MSALIDIVFDCEVTTITVNDGDTVVCGSGKGIRVVRAPRDRDSLKGPDASGVAVRRANGARKDPTKGGS